jgi:hypothetical protein
MIFSSGSFLFLKILEIAVLVFLKPEEVLVIRML